MPFLELDEVKIHYATWDKNEGPWVTLVNGYTRTLTDFRAMAKSLCEQGFRVVTFDNRGAGKAECPPVFSLEEIGDDILALWEKFQVERGSLLGISYGGAIAATLAARIPERIEKLILVSTPVSVDYLSCEIQGPAKNPRRFISDITQYFSEDFLKKNKILVDGFFRQTLKTFQEPDTALGARAQRESMAELNLAELLPKISCPTLILHGEKDRIVNLESAKFLAAHLKSSKLEILPGIGHLLLAECPREFYQRVGQFLREGANG